MTTKELRKCLAKVPDDADVCVALGNDVIPMYDIENNQVFTFRGDSSLGGANVDLRKSKRESPYLDKIWLGKAHRFFEEGKRKVGEKHDGKVHEIQVIFSRWDQYFFGAKLNRSEWMTLVVDNYRERGEKLGVGRQWTVCETKRFSPI